MQTGEGKLFLFVGIDHTRNLAVTRPVDKADRRPAWEFLEHPLTAVPYRIYTILTDSGIQFAEQPRNRNAACNFARRLKTLSGLIPYGYIAKVWTSEPDRFIVNPIHQMPGLNT